MSIAATILKDPKIKAIFVASLKARRVEIAEEDGQIVETLKELAEENNGPRSEAPIPPAKERAKGQRMRKGEPERLIALEMSQNPLALYSSDGFKPLAGIASSTAWRVLRKLHAAGKIIQAGDKWFKWNQTDLPVAGGNGKGAET